jgi:hypothetical protein
MNLSEQAFGLTFTPEIDKHVHRDGKSLGSLSAASFLGFGRVSEE